MLSGIGPGSLLLVLIIVLLLFGTKKLRNVGSDLGAAIKNFRSAAKHEDDDNSQQSEDQAKVIEGESRKDESN